MRSKHLGIDVLPRHTLKYAMYNTICYDNHNRKELTTSSKAAILLTLSICLLNNFYCDAHSGGYPSGNLLESVQ